MINKIETIKYTTTLPLEFVNDLKTLASQRTIPSVNYGIREAISLYLHDVKKQNYEFQMRAPACDKDFIERTMDCDEDFFCIDCEVSDNDQ